MTVKKRVILFIAIIGVFVFSMFSFLFFGNVTKTLAQDVFGVDEGVTITQNSKVSDAFLNGRTGYEFSTLSSGQGFRLKSGSAGEFGISFMPVSDKNGVADFTELSFEFSSEESRMGFTLKFIATDGGVTMRLVLSNSKSYYKDYATSGSFANLADEPMCFYFDPSRMVVLDAGKTPIIDLKDESLLAEFNTRTIFDSYKLYNVDISFSKINDGKTAKIIVFEVCGQSLSGNALTDSSAPLIYDTPTLNGGVVGKVYKLPKNLSTYDFVDGIYQEFQGEISVYDDENEKITLADDCFTPTASGTYYAHYTPIDNAQNRGETVVLEFNVLNSASSVVFNYDYPVANGRVLGVNSRVNFPSVYGVSSLTDDKINVTATISLDDTVIYENEKSGLAFSYVFESVGDYVVKFKATDVDGETYYDEYPITVLATAPTYNVFIDDEYSKDKGLDLTKTTATINDALVEVSVKTTYPSGRVQSSKTIVLDEIGGYKTEFTVAESDVVYVRYYNVRNSNASLWEGNAAMQVESNAIAPDYADYAYNGTMLTTTMPVEAFYKNNIDLSDNTKDDLLCEFFVAPSTAGAIETSCIDVILTDAYDSTKLFTVRFTLGIWTGYNKNVMMSAMALTSRDFARSDLDSFNTSGFATENFYYYSTRVYSSFYGKISNSSEDYPSQSVKVYFDYAEGKVYTDNAIKGTAYGGTGAYGKQMIADLTDERFVGAGKGWKSFTTGEAKLSVKITGISKEAHVMMLNVDGQSMAGEYTADTNAPSIFVDYAGNTEKNLPNAVVGEKYKIFNAYSVDLVDGYGHNVKTSVYKKDNGVLKDVEFGNGYFTPTTVGDYVIRYSATDSFGMTAVKDVPVKAISQDDYKELGYTFSDKNKSEVDIGQSYKIENGTAFGGSGKISVETYVTLNGERVEVDADGIFIINESGTYVLTTVLKDYIKESAPFTLNIVAKYSSKPILEEKTVPKLILTGEEFVFPEFTAKVYTGSNPEGVSQPVKYYVNGNEITDGKYIPEVAGDIVFRVESGETFKEYTIHVNQGVEGSKYGDGNLFTKQFIYSNAKEEKMNKTSLALTFDQTCEVDVARLIDKEFIKFSIKGIEGSGLSTIECIVTDSENPAISVTILIRKKSNSGEAEIVYNGKEYAITGSFINEYFPFEVGISTDGFITSETSKIVKIEKTDGGISFNGFTSGKVYVSFRFSDVASESTIGISQIAGQNFKSTIRYDGAAPTINVLGDFDEIELNQTIVIPAAAAYDFISSVKSLTVTVKAPNGDIVVNNASIYEEISITASQVGTYIVEYSAEDTLGNYDTRPQQLTVMDREPPTITLNGQVVSTGRVGESISLPTMTVSDNTTATKDIITYVYYIAPSGKTVRINGGAFTPEEKGVYVIVYFAQDESSATSIQRYIIEVK